MSDDTLHAANLLLLLMLLLLHSCTHVAKHAQRA